ncbi:MAG: ribosome biogenesis GTPase Der [bacterium]
MEKTKKTQLPLVSFVGRPNVGKSTIFNRLIGRRVAIVDDTPGVTRDRIFGRCTIAGKQVYIVDTGGLTSYTDKSEMDANIQKQAMLSFEDSTVLVLVVDAQAGLLPEDEYAANILRKHKCQVIVAANKADNEKMAETASEFFALGFGAPVPVSALHGFNMPELKERIGKFLPPTERLEERGRAVRFCMAGHPNVGKSSIVNAILGEERCVVSPVPGTTRDRVDSEFTYEGRPFVIVDTAGIRRRKLKMDKLEFYSSTRARNAIAESDVAILVLDAKEGIIEGDKRLVAEIIALKKGLVIAVNKMDLVDEPAPERFVNYLSKEASFLRHTPVVFMSALKSEGIDVLLDTLVDVYGRMNEMLPHELLRNVVLDVRALYSPRSRGKVFGEIKAVLHDRTNPPRVVIKVNDKGLFTPGYIRMIESHIRNCFDLTGVPLDLSLSAPPPKKRKKK